MDEVEVSGGESKVQRNLRLLHGTAQYAVRIDQGYSDIRIAKQLLTCTYIIVCLQKVSGKKWRSVCGDSRGDFYAAHGHIDCLLETGFMQVIVQLLSGLGHDRQRLLQ